MALPGRWPGEIFFSAGYISHAFGSLDQPWEPGYLRSAYGAICCHRFKPPNQTDDIFALSRPELQGLLRKEMKADFFIR